VLRPKPTVEISLINPVNSAVKWPKQSQLYCVYKRGASGKSTGSESPTKDEITGIMTFGLSNPYQNTLYYGIGTGIELVLEAPTAQSRMRDIKTGMMMTGLSISKSWMFTILNEVAHQCFALGVQIRQLLEQVLFILFFYNIFSNLSFAFFLYRSCH
jgi:hypothetical protein